MIRSIPLEKGKMKKKSFSKKGTEAQCLGQNFPKKHHPKLEKRLGLKRNQWNWGLGAPFEF